MSPPQGEEAQLSARGDALEGTCVGELMADKGAQESCNGEDGVANGEEGVPSGVSKAAVGEEGAMT